MKLLLNKLFNKNYKGGINKMDNFKIFEKGRMGAPRIADEEISVGNNVIGFGGNAQRFVGEQTHMEIYFDEDNFQIGLKPTNSQDTGFKLQRKGNQKAVDYITGSFVKKLPMGRYRWESRNGLIIFKVAKFSRD